MALRPLLLSLSLLSLPCLLAARPDAAEVDGRVVADGRPIAEARVRWQCQPAFFLSDPTGAFRLRAPPKPGTLITVSKPGYRIAAIVPVGRELEISLERLPAEDNEHYAWIRPHANSRQPNNCGNCHAEIYREWAGSAHAGSARNPKFLQLFADPDGKSPPGWDLSREHPLGMGVCATCHAPTLGAEFDNDIRRATGVAADGIHCDFCHKIADAPADAKLGVRFGRDGLVLLRPRNGEQLFFGPLEDAVRPGESFAHLPLYRESRYCASCHEGKVFGVPVYSTYSEWLESPAGKQGIACQWCHMTPTGRLTNIAPGKGGIDRDPRTLGSHGFAGGQLEMLRHCLAVDVRGEPTADGLRVHVVVSADRVGHRVPTGYIDRHLVLAVDAFDAAGKALPLAGGPRLPDVAGDLAGRAGWLYGKVLRDEQGIGPRPFWIPGCDVNDTRLAPGEPDKRSFVFPVGTARVEVRLWYRRFWHQVASARGWSDNDVLVLEQMHTW